jgi:hypothetical protein
MASGHSRPAGEPAATGSSRTTVTLIVVGVIVVGLLAATGIVALLRGGDGDSAATAAGSPSPSVSSASPPTSSPSPSVSSGLPSASSHPTTAPTAPTKKATTAPAATAPSGPRHVAGTYTGHGSKILKIQKPGNAAGPVLIVATHPGGGSFGVLALDSTLHESGVLINAAGSYQGTTLLDGQGTQTQSLQVRAHGAWTLTIKPVSAVRSVDARAKGNGDDVLRYAGTKGLATFDCRGCLNFVVTYVGQKNAVLVDEVGSYHGQVRIQKGPALISVKANAAWSMTVAP